MIAAAVAGVSGDVIMAGGGGGAATEAAGRVCVLITGTFTSVLPGASSGLGFTGLVEVLSVTSTGEGSSDADVIVIAEVGSGCSDGDATSDGMERVDAVGDGSGIVCSCGDSGKSWGVVFD